MDTNQDTPQREQPLWIKRTNPKYERLLSTTYRHDEIIIFFKQPPTPGETDKLKQAFRKDGIDPASILIRKCDNCDIPVQLWKAKDIHSLINTEGVKVGSGPGTTTVGEKYSLNFFNNLPFDKRDRPGKNARPTGHTNDRKEKIIVAVLDTGFDASLVDSSYLWQGTAQSTDLPCYKDVTTGWNFINDTANFSDDNPNRHGSIVSQYIINQFEKSDHAVQIMPLKTHDNNGVGDLFSIICAVHFAIAKGAHIINASWGFYYYYSFPIPYLQELISVILKKRGVLFITAAGNKFDEEEAIAKALYLQEHGVPVTDDQLRNLAIHNFYPAHLSGAENSIITVTTTDGRRVSPTQNFSNVYTDLGVLADKITTDGMKFLLPFAGSSPLDLISGSSFATAIASGIIGAFCPKSLYHADIQKQQFLDALMLMATSTGRAPGILVKEPVLEKKYINKGAYTKKIG